MSEQVQIRELVNDPYAVQMINNVSTILPEITRTTESLLNIVYNNS
jgi:hypothetical protein